MEWRVSARYVVSGGRGTDEVNRRSNGDRPGGGATRRDVRFLSSAELEATWHELSAGSGRLPDDGRYAGVWYRTPNGGTIGLRNSPVSGWTIDLRSGEFFRHPWERMRFRIRRAVEDEVASPPSELEVRGYVFDVDDKPMWDFHGAAGFVAKGPEDERAFVRECVLRMLEAGAIPYEVARAEPWGRSAKRWEGLSPEAIADDVVAATFAAPDVFEANIWWMDGDWWKSLDHEAAARLPRPEGH